MNARILLMILLVPFTTGAFGYNQKILDNATSNAASTTSVAVENDASAGNLVICVFASDNSGIAGSDGDNGEHTLVADSQGNTWYEIYQYTNDQGGLRQGATVSAWQSNLSTALTVSGGDTIDFSVEDTGMNAKAFVCEEFTVGSGNIGNLDQTSVSALDNSEIGTRSVTPSSNQEWLFLHFVGMEINSGTWTAGSGWTACNHTGAQLTGNPSHSKMGARCQYQITTTGSAVQTTGSSWGGTGDHANVEVNLGEGAPPAAGRQRNTFGGN